MQLLPNMKPTTAQISLLGAKVFTCPSGGTSLLDHVIDNMDVNTSSTTTPHSTPSAFEQAAQTHTFLKEPGNWPSVASVAIQNWRALMVLLALDKFSDPYAPAYGGERDRKFGIGFRRIPFGIITNLRNNINVQEADISSVDNLFVKSALSYAVLPKPLSGNKNFGAGGNTDWLSIYSIIYDYDPKGDWDKDKVIGMTSPSTIVTASKDFRSLIPEGIFNFIPFDGTFTQALAADNGQFGVSVNQLLAQQFKNFSDESLKAVYEWLLRIKDNCPAGSVCSGAIESFIESIKFRIGSALVKDEWDFPENHFSQEAFTNDTNMRGYEPLNNSMLKVPLVREWYALFAILALREIKGIPVTVSSKEIKDIKDAANAKGAVISVGGKAIAELSEHTLIAPLPDIGKQAGFSWIVDMTLEYDFKLTQFECECILQWLTRIKNDGNFAIIRGVRNNEALTYAEKFEDILENMLRDQYSSARKAPWAENRFASIEIPNINNKLKVFQLTIHPYIAPFFEDNDGAYQQAILRDWFNALSAIAFSDIRDIAITTAEVASDDMRFNLYDVPSDLYKHNVYKRFAYTFENETQRYDNEKLAFAVTSRSTIIAVCNPESVKRCALDTLLVPGELDLPGRTLMKKRGTTPGNINVFDHALYDFETVLLKEWFAQLIKKLDMDTVLYAGGSKDKNAIIKHLKNKIDSLGYVSSDNIDVTNSDYAVYGSYYVNTDKPVSADSTINTVNSYIKDNFFSKYLIFTDDPSAKLRNDTFNRGTEESVYAIHTKQNHRFTCERNEGIVVLPLSDSAAGRLHKNAQTNRGVVESDRFGLKSVKTYKGTFEDGSENLEAEFHLTDSTVPIIKAFTSSKIIRCSTVGKMLPGVVVWPDVEIENWTAYFLSIDRTDAVDTSAPKVTLPQFIEQHENPAENIIEKFPLNKTEIKDLRFDSYRCKSYPLMLKVDFRVYNVQSSGYLLVRPCDTQYVMLMDDDMSDEREQINKAILKERNEKGYVRNSDAGTAVIGIDFGTTNTTAFMRYSKAPADAPGDELDFRLAGTNYVTHGYFANNASSRPYDSIVAQHPIYDPQNREVPVNVLTSTLMKYKSLAEIPLIDANIYRLVGHEIVADDKLLNRPDKLFMHSMKWNDVTPEDIRVFFLQITMMCCIAAIKKYRISNIEIRISYPISLPENNRMLIKEQWDLITGSKLKNLVGINVTVSDGGADSYFYSESYASGTACVKCKGLYAKNHEFVLADHNEGFVCVDIGGGSTDISVFWHDTPPRETISIPFAGQLLLSAAGTEPYRERTKQFLKTIHTELHTQLRKLTTAQQIEIGLANLKNGANQLLLFETPSRLDMARTNGEFAFLVDVIVGNFAYIYNSINKIKKEDADFAQFISTFRTKDHAREFLANIKFGLSSMAYFIGTFLRKLIDEGRFDLIRHDMLDHDSLKLYFAGTGSKVLDWFVSNEERGLSSYKLGAEQTKYILKQYIKKGLGTDRELDIEIYRSHKPKQEVAMGLVHAEASQAAMNALKKDSLVKLDIEGLYFSAHRNPSFKFKEVVKRRLKEIGYSLEDANALTSGSSNEKVYEDVTKKLNPLYEPDNVAKYKSEYFNVVGSFLKAFYEISPNDYSLIFRDVEVDPDGKLTIEENRALVTHLDRQFALLVSKLNRANADELPMPVAEFLPFILLKYVSLIIKGTYVKNDVR